MRTEQQIRAELDQAESTRRRLRKELRKSKGLPAKRKGQGVRIGDRNDALKAERGYVEPGSFVRRDGSEKLVGVDWRKRKELLWNLADGRCERISKLGRVHEPECNTYGDDPHHIKKRWPRRDDRMENLVLLSRACHRAEDPRKVRSGKVGAA